MKLPSIVVSSRIRLARNIEDIPFPTKLTDGELYMSIVKAMYEIYGDEYEFRQLKNMMPNQCLLLLERHIISKELIQNKDISSYALNQDEQTSIMINEEDHIREQCIMPGLSLKECYQKISVVDDKLLDVIDVAFSKDFGFLTSSPKNVGTGMKASVILFLPALSMSFAIKNVNEMAKERNVLFSIMADESGMTDSYFYKISNIETTGKTEEEIIKDVNDFTDIVIELEEKARNTIKSLNKSVIIDMCYRAYGILTNCYSIGLNECFSCLSKLRFGIVTNIIKTKHIDIDELYVLVQPAHLEYYYEKTLTPKQRDIYRAKFIGDILKDKLIKENYYE